MIDFLKRLLGIKPRPKVYLTVLKPCPCCGGRHLKHKIKSYFYLKFQEICCEDCGFYIEMSDGKFLISEWEQLLRKEHMK